MSAEEKRIPVLFCGESRIVWESLAEVLRRTPDFQFLGLIEAQNPPGDEILADGPVILLCESRIQSSPSDDSSSTWLERYPQMKRVCMLPTDEDRFLAPALQSHWSGYVTFHDSVPDFLEVLRQVAAGQQSFSPSLQSRIRWNATTKQYHSKHEGLSDLLSRRQLEILQCLARGNSVKEVAREMHLSLKTVDSHKYRIMRKLGIHDRVQITRIAIREGLLAP